ncbi:hypothetical protein [Actinomadura parmotrematis]|uniref:Uncharacterized protein n=1 Tax=Actinomadura parmotrematis TaxID=2864039 RepID=A0ABS7FVZ4_9ACTN|nr:hypothetical protein [Actinomadura parmotrematis]MBW8484609.1 hypothetical protein [Actinomadura parmotrematis]
MTRPKHNDKELDQVFAEAWRKGWRITRDKRYWKLWCPCRLKHFKTVKLTPSDPRYKTNLVKHLGSRTCWNEESE